MLPDIPPVLLEGGQLSEIKLSYLTDSIRSIIRALNGGITFGDATNGSLSGNIDGEFKEFTFVLANVDYILPHELGRVPIGMVVLDVNQDGAVVRGTNRGSWGLNNFQLRCSVANTTALFVVV